MAQQIKNGNFPSEFRDIQHISPESAEIIGQNQSPITLRFDGSNIPDNIEEILTILAKHDHNKNKITILPAYYENMFQRIKERTLA